MKVVLVHNHYQQAGGEDAVFADEAALLTGYGHEVVRYTLHNDALHTMSGWQAAARTLWNPQVYSELLALLQRERPALMHCTNTFPLISPAAYFAAGTAKVPVVQSLHNYRLLCPNGLLLREGQICEDCLGKRLAWHAVQHGCYRGSRAASAVVTGMLTAHRTLGTWTRQIDRYIALTEFARRKFIQGGLPAERLVVKPNFVAPDTGPGGGQGGYAVYVGRLSAEKGIASLLAAWSQVQIAGADAAAASVPLKIVGDGPLAAEVQTAAAANPAIEWLGQRPLDEVQTLIADAALLIVPSVCYEGLPKAIAEAFCQGTPVLVSRVGALPDLVEHGRTGLVFEAGNVQALAQAVSEAFSGPEQLTLMRRAARREFELQYTAHRNYQRLMEIYADVLLTRGNHAAAEACSKEASLAEPARRESPPTITETPYVVAP